MALLTDDNAVLAQIAGAVFTVIFAMINISKMFVIISKAVASEDRIMEIIDVSDEMLAAVWNDTILRTPLQGMFIWGGHCRMRRSKRRLPVQRQRYSCTEDLQLAGGDGTEK